MISLVQVTAENHEFYLDRILEIEIRSFSAPWSRNGFLQELENPVSEIWALISGRDLLGYFCFWAVRDEIQLLDLAVHPQHRGHGFGSYLLSQMISFASARGIFRIWLEVRASGATARRLYERFGFVESGRRKNYYTAPEEDAVVMSLALTGNSGKNFATDKRAGEKA
jgi:ribosomal-protein-alanine N-acetyltransferase